MNVDFGKSVHATLGGYYSDEKTTYYTLQDIRYVAFGPTVPGVACPGLPTPTCPIFPLQFIGNDPVKTQSEAAFAQATWDATEALSFTGGLRYSKDSKDYTYYRYNLDGVTINPFVDPVGAANGIGYDGPNGTASSGSTAKFDGNRTDYHVSADYRFNPAGDGLCFRRHGLQVGRRRPPSVQRRAGHRVRSGETDLVRDRFEDRSVRPQGPVQYRRLLQRLQGRTVGADLSCPQFGGPGPCALPQNAGDAKVSGVEVEITAVPVEGLQLDLSGSYLHWDWKCVNPRWWAWRRVLARVIRR